MEIRKLNPWEYAGLLIARFPKEKRIQQLINSQFRIFNEETRSFKKAVILWIKAWENDEAGDAKGFISKYIKRWS